MISWGRGMLPLIAPTVHPDLAAVWNLATGLALLAFATEQHPPRRRQALIFLAVLLVWTGALAVIW